MKHESHQRMTRAAAISIYRSLGWCRRSTGKKLTLSDRDLTQSVHQLPAEKS